MLKKLFNDESLILEFDEDVFTFNIVVDGKPPFDFNTLSSGYSAVLDIIVDLMLRMQKKTKRKYIFDMAGIVLIDEVDAHLHIELQKQVLPMLTQIFPNIQFIVTTHSPFILNSIDNVVIFDIENKTLVDDSLTNVSYEGIVKGYFNANTMSNEIQSKFNEYKKLVCKENLTDSEKAEISKLEVQLNNIPDFLSLDMATEYKRLKLEFRLRG